MRKTILQLVFLCILSIMKFTAYGQDKIFEKINNKTWYENYKNNVLEANIVFYKTTNGLIKAIRQLIGSAFPVVSSEIYDVVIRRDTVFLFNGLNLKTSEKLEDSYYNYNNKTGLLIKNGNELKIIHEEPILYAWTTKLGDFTQIDVNLLKKISIGKNEIYKDKDLNKILIDMEE